MSSRDVSGPDGSQPGDGWDRDQRWPEHAASRSGSRGYQNAEPRPGTGPANTGSYAGRRRRDDGYPSQRATGERPRPRLVPNDNQARLAGDRQRPARPRFEPRPADQYSDGYGTGPRRSPGGRGPGGHGPGGGGPGGPGPRNGRGGNGGRGGGRGTGTGPNRVKVKGSWWRHWTWKKLLGVAAAGFGGFVLLVVAGVSYAYATTEVPTDAAQAATQQQSTVYFSDGKTVAGTLGTTDRQLLTYNQISPYMRDAVVAAEDRSFYNEGGVSPRGIVRAAYEDMFNSGGSQGSLQGGSTITQEFVRNYYANIGTQQTATRKIKEIFVALKVAKEKSKAWILTNYLNTIYLGNGAYGVGAAAKTYFGVSASQLTVAQSAEIAAIIQSPSYYPTQAGQPALIQRWHYVLNGMVTMGDISAAKAASLKFPVPFKAHDQTAGGSAYDQYVLDIVKNELSADYGLTSAQWDNDGLRIVTTLSKPMMDDLYHAVNVNEKQMAADGGALPSYAMVGAELQDPQTGTIAAFYGGPGEHVSKQDCHGTCQLNTVLQREQVGSSFKPYVLATAVNQGMDVQTTQLDGYSPLWIPPDSEGTTPAARSQSAAQSNWFEEKNDNNDDYGPMTVANAEAQSSNTAFTDLIHRVGTQNVINMAQKFGVNTGSLTAGGSGLQGDVGHVGMALGQDSLSINEQDTMLATLDNNGTYHAAHLIQQISSATINKTATVKTAQVLTPDKDSQVQYAMSFDTVNGTGTAAAMNDGRPIIAKTGTTDSARSLFFVGAIPQYALTVGIFTKDQGSTINGKKNTETLATLGGNVGGGFGGYWPARIWHSFAQDAFASLPIQQFPTPEFSGTAWNMFGADGVPATATPTPTQTQTQPRHHHFTPPAVPVVPVPTPSAGFPSTQPTTAPTCNPFQNPNCNNGNGGGGGPATNGAAALGGSVLLVSASPLQWLRSRRKRKRR
ncbi:MAG TPA: transglycosylase domain-containing protein [Streptosporangiaceae bacterium]|nr:transglycosylase domain-containing protein [Streptosporangiaceae bacterium]